ncbi:nucleotide modification associated domain-containing protein [Brachyspira hyodysenteriae]|uniref:nucleotide modification associated domain-containing protein n=1 Tax=Brachyspira hyodysenteriae TaxID=159 RepID=UPI000A705A3B|nr:nucleotide modification associated domain-containing protein [Brachyspira hyodysenteriae]
MENKEKQIKEMLNDLSYNLYLVKITSIDIFEVELKAIKTNCKNNYKDFIPNNLKDLFMHTISYLSTEYYEGVYDILKELETLLIRKNKDYNNSFDKTVAEYGYVVIAIRLEDKINRLKNLKNNKNQVTNESLKDTLLDIAGYCVLALIYIKENI